MRVPHLAGEQFTTPCLLDGSQAGYLADGGAADLFAVRRRLDGTLSRRHLVARIPAGAVVPSSTALGVWRLLLVPLPGTTLHAIPSDRTRLLDRIASTARLRTTTLAFATAIDRALIAVADALRSGQPPRGTTIVRGGQFIPLVAGEALAADSTVTWLRTAGGELCSGAGGVAGGHELLVLAGRDWVEARTDCAVETLTTVDLLADGHLWTALDGHIARLLRVVEQRIRDGEAAQLARIDDRKRVNAAMVGSAARQSVSVLGVGVALAEAPHDEVDLYARAAAVLRVVVTDPDLVREPVDRSRAAAGERDTVHLVARSSALHTREVALPPDWRRRDLGPLIGWRPVGEPDPSDPTQERPVRAVPMLFRHGRYHAIDPETLARGPVDDLAGHALAVQTPMAADGGLRGLLGAGLRGARLTARGTLISGLLVAALGLATPAVSGAVLGGLARDGAPADLLGVSALFVLSALVAALVAIVNNLLLLRLEGRAETDTQMAVWDRLMRLPVRFFTKTTSGELASQVLGVAFIREALGGLLSQALFATLTTSMVIVMLLVVDAAVGGLAIGVVVVTTVVTAVLGLVVVRRQRKALPLEHRLSALTNQLLGGITKVKLAAAEDRAYSRWAAGNAAARRALQRVRTVQALLLAVSTALPMAGQLLLLAMLAGPFSGRVGPGEFFVVNTGFLMLVGMALVLVATSVEALALLPRVEDLGELATAEPEARTERVDPGELRGEIEVAGVTFAYSDDSPAVLDDLSLRIRPGQFVAIVGPSGCGKSTLLRLLLGFEQPRSGSVLYDGQDLGDLDVAAVRRQCGTVLQDGQLFAGTLRENIAGAGNYSLERLWDAARMAGIDADIADLPMGMSTMIPFGGGTLSVGQRQRLLIARALVGRPRILFFDEATSALDNRTQEIVTASTNALAATRVVIAHRLSTVVDADIIVVMDRGHVVQSGRYEQLMTDDAGLFAQLARRQLLDEP